MAEEGHDLTSNLAERERAPRACPGGEARIHSAYRIATRLGPANEPRPTRAVEAVGSGRARASERRLDHTCRTCSDPGGSEGGCRCARPCVATRRCRPPRPDRRPTVRSPALPHGRARCRRCSLEFRTSGIDLQAEADPPRSSHAWRCRVRGTLHHPFLDSSIRQPRPDRHRSGRTWAMTDPPFATAEGLRLLLLDLAYAGRRAWQTSPEADELMTYTMEKYAGLRTSTAWSRPTPLPPPSRVMRMRSTRVTEDPWAVPYARRRLVTRSTTPESGDVLLDRSGAQDGWGSFHDAERFGDRDPEGTAIADYHPAFHFYGATADPYTEPPDEPKNDQRLLRARQGRRVLRRPWLAGRPTLARTRHGVHRGSAQPMQQARRSRTSPCSERATGRASSISGSVRGSTSARRTR